MATVDQYLEAGALVPTKARPKKVTAVDAVSARAYSHPALAAPIVRLCADNLAPGEDLTMEYLGFDDPQVTDSVAKRTRQAIGFPEWALINDPKHAKFALDLVKEFRKESRRARSKPGHAYDAFSEIADRLGASVAHFLPSFWEQVGRDYILAGNSTYASRAFGKAREAESVHGLQIDEQVRRDAFLEFALAGCVSAKALTEYGKELQAKYPGEEAWQFMRDLSVRRTLGGMPPWTAMCKDLASLVKAAGLDVELEIRGVLAEILESPAISRASLGFWKAADRYIAGLAAEDSRVSGLLLNLIPQRSAWNQDDIWPWLDCLKKWGILNNVWEADPDSAEGPVGGAAAWISRVIKLHTRPQQRLYEILQAAAPRLQKDGVPVEVFRTSRWGSRTEAEIDFVDMAMELAVPLPEVPSELTLSLGDWAKAIEEGDSHERPRDPVFLSKNKSLRTALLEAVEGVAGSATFEKAARGKAALLEARRDWLLQQVNLLACQGLPSTNDALHVLEKKTTLATFREFPDALTALEGINPLPSLTRTINAGLFDEYGWPRLEETVERLTSGFTRKLDGTKSQTVSIFGAFPYAIVCDGLNAVVVRGDEIVHEAEVTLEKGSKVVGLQFFDGELLVEAKGTSKGKRYWNNSPEKQVEAWLYRDAKIDGTMLDLPDGGSFFGNEVVHAGDSAVLNGYSMDRWFSDGSSFFRTAWSEADATVAIREVDIKTNRTGRKSMPSFFEDYIEDDAELLINQLKLYRYGELLDGSPMGAVDGAYGFRCRQRKNGQVQAERTDGKATDAADPSIIGLLDQPTSDLCLPVVMKNSYHRGRSDNLMLMDSTGKFVISPSTTGAGQVLQYPDDFLHYLRVRDVATSKKLRKLKDKDLKPLVAAESEDFANWQGEATLPKEGTDYPQLDKALHKLLPKIQSDRLYVGLRSAVIRFGRLQRRLDRLRKNRDPARQKQTSRSVATGADATIESTLRVFNAHVRSHETGLFDAMSNVAAFLKGESRGDVVPFASVQLMNFCVKAFARKMWYLNWINEDNSETRWHEFARAVAATGILDLPGQFRSYGSRFSGDPPFSIQKDENGKDIDLRSTAMPFVGKSSRFLIGKEYYGFSITEYTENDAFEPLENSTQQKPSDAHRNFWSSQKVGDYIELCAKKERQLPGVPFFEELAKEMDLSVSEVGLMWLGYPNMTSRLANFMPAHLRKALKLKTKPLSSAKSSLEALSADTREGLVEALLDGDPADLWADHEAMGERLKAAWRVLKPDRLELPMDLMDELSDGYSYGVDARQMLVALNNPSQSELFSPAAKYEFDDRNNLKSSTGHELSANQLKAAAFSVCQILSRLPAGHSAREKMPAVREALLAALDNTGLLIETDVGYYHDEKEPQKVAEAALKATFGKTKKLNGQMMGERGGVTAVVESWRVNRYIAPAKLNKAKDYDQVGQILLATTGGDNEDFSVLETIRLIRSPEFRKLCERVGTTSVPDGEFECNPRHSRPKLVREVQKKFEVSENAAAYYLQVLTLHDPTDKNVKTWNGWTAAQIKKAAAELVERDLVLEAKRARAGRKVFLPGAWEALKSPHLPLETWKLPLYQLDRAASGYTEPILDRILPLEPVDSLFDKAWKRLASGDVPRYEEV